MFVRQRTARLAHRLQVTTVGSMVARHTRHMLHGGGFGATGSHGMQYSVASSTQRTRNQALVTSAVRQHVSPLVTGNSQTTHGIVTRVGHVHARGVTTNSISNATRNWAPWAALATFVGVGYVVREQYLEFKDAVMTKNQGDVLSVGKASIGGPFTLVDQDGNTVTEKDFRGKFMLIYFGFTHCPDVCPTELEKMHDALKALEKLPEVRARIQPVFVSVDHKRDTPAVIKEYIKEFGIEDIVSLTGSPEQIEQVTKAYRVFFSRSDDGNEESEDYLIDHSIFTYLMGPDGSFKHIFGVNMEAEAMAATITQSVLVDLHANASNGSNPAKDDDE